MGECSKFQKSWALENHFSMGKVQNFKNPELPKFNLKTCCIPTKLKLEDLTVLKRSTGLLNNVEIGQDQLQLIMKHILFYGGCGHFGQVK